jgi:hypothetical protein
MAATDTHATIEELLEALFSVWSVPRLYNEEQLRLREGLETAVTGVWVNCESRRPVRTWTRKLRKLRRWKPLPGDNRWRYSRLRTLSTCCSESQSAWISVSAVIICSYVLQEFCKSDYHSKPVYSHTQSRDGVFWSFSVCKLVLKERIYWLVVDVETSSPPYVSMVWCLIN